jgi:Asp/Glu/hydantoin racemase
MLERLALTLGFAPQLAGIHTVTQSGAELARDRKAAHAILLAACSDAAERFGAKSIILGGAGLAGMAADIATALQTPVIDSVQAGVTHALQLAAEPTKAKASSSEPARNQVFDFAWKNVSTELSNMGTKI